mgnify:FL=1
MVFFSNLAARMIQPEFERGIAGSCERTQTGTAKIPLKPAAKACHMKSLVFQQQSFNCKTV